MQVIGCDTCVPSACFVAFHVIIPDAEADDNLQTMDINPVV